MAPTEGNSKKGSAMLRKEFPSFPCFPRGGPPAFPSPVSVLSSSCSQHSAASEFRADGSTLSNPGMGCLDSWELPDCPQNSSLPTQLETLTIQASAWKWGDISSPGGCTCSE